MKKSNFEKKLHKTLKEEEHYVLNILLLSYLVNDESYKDIAELCFMFDEYSNFKKFIRYYGGKTLTIPTQEELRLALKHLLLFQYVKIDGKDFDESYLKVGLKDMKVSKDEALNTIDKFYNYLKENGNQIFKGKRRNNFF